VFVADSQIDRMEANLESMENLQENLAEQGYDLLKIPMVIQYNKRDLPYIASIDEMRELINTRGLSEYEGVAPRGVGVFETLKAIARLVFLELKKAH
jgi:signal recognition particle receptor subunit beta